jgi:putative transposase
MRDGGDGRYWDIPYRDLRLPPISLWEHQAATKQLRAEGRRSVDESLLFEIVEEQRRLADGARKSTRERRAAQRRRQNTDSVPGVTIVGRDSHAPDPADRDAMQAFEVEEWE